MSEGFHTGLLPKKTEFQLAFSKTFVKPPESTIQTMHKYASAMELGAKEIAYFEALVNFNNASNNNENRYFDEMVSLRGRSSVKFRSSAV